MIGDGGGDPVDGEGGQKRTHKKKKKEEEVFLSRLTVAVVSS